MLRTTTTSALIQFRLWVVELFITSYLRFLSRYRLSSKLSSVFFAGYQSLLASGLMTDKSLLVDLLFQLLSTCQQLISELDLFLVTVFSGYFCFESLLQFDLLSFPLKCLCI